MRDHAQQAAHGPRGRQHVDARDQCLPCGRPDPGGQHSDRGGLAGPVRPEQPEDLPLDDRKAEPVDRVGLRLRVALDQLPDLYSIQVDS